MLNYSPCCVHYRESCCELHARSECPAPNEVEGIKVAGRKVAGRKEAGIASSAKGEVSSAKGEVCGELLGLLACARCSPVSANFTRRTGELVLCASFCRYLVFTRPRILHRKRSNQPQTPQPQRSPIPTILSLFSLHQESTQRLAQFCLDPVQTGNSTERVRCRMPKTRGALPRSCESDASARIWV